MRQQHFVGLRCNAIDRTVILLFRDHACPAQVKVAGNDADTRLTCRNRLSVKQRFSFFNHHPAVGKILHRAEGLFLLQQMICSRPLSQEISLHGLCLGTRLYISLRTGEHQHGFRILLCILQRLIQTEL